MVVTEVSEVSTRLLAAVIMRCVMVCPHLVEVVLVLYMGIIDCEIIIIVTTLAVVVRGGRGGKGGDLIYSKVQHVQYNSY